MNRLGKRHGDSRPQKTGHPEPTRGFPPSSEHAADTHLQSRQKTHHDAPIYAHTGQKPADSRTITRHGRNKQEDKADPLSQKHYQVMSCYERPPWVMEASGEKLAIDPLVEICEAAAFPVDHHQLGYEDRAITQAAKDAVERRILPEGVSPLLLQAAFAKRASS